MSGFRKATKQAKNLVISFQGASGAGKTYSALSVATALCPPGKRIAFLDTEKSAVMYADSFDFDVDDDFGAFGKLNYGPKEWMRKLHAARDAGDYGVVVLDSLTHMWKGPGGILAMLDDDAAAIKAKTGRFADTNALWKKYTPIYDGFMNDLRHLGMHVIFCLRAKEKTERKQNAQTNKTEITKLGLEPEFREGFAYDIDAQILIDEDHIAVAKKHRLQSYLNDKVFPNPGKNLAEALIGALAAGVTDEPTPAAVLVAADVEEPTPDTVEAVVPAPAAEGPGVAKAKTLGEEYLEQIKATTTTAELKALSQTANNAKKLGQIAGDDWKAVLTAFTVRMKKLSEVAA